ncbi:hemagglutinin repeat-containing protein [Paraburkholderia sp. SUR17]|uniref:hemagglutinin repeat-containing protein n=1 Tax=Paraburkholderia sp. SUR17 TaxID=3034358 RepID=UPI0024086903|nr:hemagglutinin repeat-containing protein [Paraburkholderia sp. SUR17]WEY39738.1 hemagglutinin repeat-containing protein [Paraburkholderia sp. SUR17]
MQPLVVDAQVVAAPGAAGTKTAVGVSANGLPVVQIATPNGAGVSNNTYTQYNVGSSGLVLNNSANNVLTQQAGYVAGNPNLASGSARVIVNQVVGGNASQLLGYTEVAGQRAEVVIANPAGIYCNGCGFINTSRGILTTGTPVFGGTGSLDAFHVTGGQIQVGAAGLNGSNVDQVDLIARSVAINGKVWAGQSLNVVAGNNDVRHDDLSAQWLGSDGNSPGVAIDVAQLGGMYAGKIRLVGTEAGVGVNSAGTIASQSGDVQLNSQGKVTLSGTTSASGNVAITAADDVSNSGSVYATGDATLNSQGQITNSGTVAALGNTTVTAASVNSGGALGAGVDASGNVTGAGSLTVTGTGAVTATGRQMSGGNLTLSGSSLNMAGAQTLTRGNAALIATGAGGDTGNIVHAGGSLQVGGSLTANAAGTFSNDQGQTGAAQLGVTAGAISNRGGTLSQTGAADTTLVASGALDNTGGTITTNAQNATLRSGSFTNANGQISQAGNGTLNIQTGSLDNSRGSIATNGRATVSAASLGNSAGSITSAQSLNIASNGDIDNTAGRLEASGAVDVSAANVQNAGGRIVSQNGDGLTLTASGQITNASGTTAQGATGGVIGGNGNATIRAASLTNSGTVTAAQTLGVTTSGALDNSGGTLNGATLSASAASLKNAGGAISGNTVSLSAPQFDNSSGQITANQLNLSATHFANAHGVLTQLGTGAMGFDVSGALDNSNGGVIQTNSTDLTLAPATLDNNGGTITHAGTGTLTIDAASGAGGVTNVGGTVTTNGRAALSAGSIDNTRGTISAQTGLAAAVAGALDNTHGQIVSNTDMSLVSGGALTNASGTIAATGDGSVQAASVTNSGSITAGGTLSTTATNTLDNSGGTLSAQTVTARAASFRNASGVVSGNTLSFVVPQLDNSGGRITANQLDLAATNLTNAQGSLTQLGSGVMGMGVSGTLDNSNGGVIQTNSTDLTLAPATLDNDGGTITHAGSGTLTIDAANGTGAVTNVGGTIVSNGRTTLSAGSVNNTGGALGGHSGLVATVSGAVDNTRGQLASNADLDVSSGGALTNTGGTMSATGNSSVQAASLTNGGTITAGQNLDATVAGSLDNSGGTMSAQSVTAHAASLRNAGGTVSANTVSLTVPQLDNSSGRIVASQLGITATNLTNGHGSLTQLGTGAIGLDVSGTIDNSNGGVIQTNSTDLTLVPAALNNNGGTITHAGTGTLTIAPGSGAGSVSNVGGHIATNGRATISVRSLDNTSGTLASQGLMSAVVQTVLNNTGGRLSSGTGLTASSGGALVNAGGVIGAGGAAAGSTLSLSASSINNAGGAITNVGTGATTVNGGSQIANSNAGGAAGMGAISGSGNVTLTAASISNTQGGQLSGANLQINAGNLDNSGGRIGNVASSTGDVGITTGGNLNNASGQIGASRNLSVAASSLVGSGAYSAVNDLTLNLQGNFTTAPGYGFSAGHNLTFTLPGTFSNGGSLAAVNGLVINAGDIQNTGTMAAGGLLATHSNTLTNTGTIVGGSLSLNATQVLQNLGTSALIGATDSAGVLELLSADIENRDDTTATDAPAMTAIYGLGRVVLAGGKDGNGNYVNAGLVHNQSGLIQSGGDMQIAANQVTNTRRAMSTSGFTSSVDPALLQSLGISLSGCTATDMAACGPGNPQVMGSKGSPTMIGGVPTDPPHGGQWNSTYQYTTYTGVAVANTVTSVSPGSQIIAGGNLNASSVGTFQNYWSQVAAAGNIAMPATLDQNSWQGQTAPQVQVTYSGEYHYDNYDNSEHNWQLPFGDAPFVGSRPGGYTQAAPADIRTYALPAYESSFTAGGTLSGTGVTLNNTAGNASVTPLGLLPGQSISGAGAGAVSGTIATGSTGGRVGAGSVNGTVSTGGGARAVTGAVQGGHIANSGLANFNNPIIAGATAVTVLNNITLPKGGLFSVDAAPNAPYLVETNPAFTSQQQWLSSDYYFQQMGMNPGQIQLRLGDGFYEQKLVQDQIMSMTGKSVLTNYANTQDEFKSLMTSGAELAKSLNLAPGTGLSPDQVSQLTSNVVIMQSQIVDGHEVLVPVVYLAKASQENMGNGPVIAATDIDLQNATTVTNSGTIKAANSFAISAQSIDSSFGTLQSGGNMALVTSGDVNLTSATVNAGNLALQAGGNLVLDTKVKTLDQVSSTGATRVTATLGPLASINVAGNAAIITGGNFEQNASSLNVGGALGMSIGGNWNLGSVQTGEHKVVERANGVSDTDMNQSVGSSVKVGGPSVIAVGGDLTATGANIKLGGGGTIAAAGNVTLQAATATSTVNSNSSGSDHHGSYAETLHTSDDAVTGTTLQSGGSLNIVSGKDINVTASTVSLDKGNAALIAAGSVNVGTATETHVSDSHETHSHSGVASHTSAVNQVDQTSTYSDGSTISADGVSIVSGKDINVTGSSIVGTHDVGLAAKGNVNIVAATDTYQDSEFHDVKHSGFSGTGGIGISYGSSEQKDQYSANSVTQSQSRSTVGSVEGNVAISAGKDVHIGGSDIVAGKAAADTTGATGNIAIQAQNITIDPSQDTANEHDHQEAHSSGISVAVTGTPLDTVRNLSSAGSSGTAFSRAQGIGNEIGASAADTPSVTLSYGRSSSSSTTDSSSLTSMGSTIRGGGNVTLVATGAAADLGDGAMMRRGPSAPLVGGDITLTGSTISAGGTTTLDANRNVTLQASTNQYAQTSQSSSSSSSFQLASPSPGDLSRWISGGPNSGGVSPSPYNAGRSASDNNGTSTQQAASTVTGNSVVVKSHTGDINVVGSGISGTQGVDLIASEGAINVLAGLDTSTNHQDSSSHQFGSLGSNGTGTGFSVGVANSHTVQDNASQTQSTMRSQIVSGNGNVTLDAKQDVTVAGSDLGAGKDLTLIGRNLNLDPGTDAMQSSMSQDSSQFGVSLALSGAAGNAVAAINQATGPHRSSDSRLAALGDAQAALAAYNAYNVASAVGAGKATGQPLIKATVSIGGGSSHSDSQSSSVANDGSTLHAGGNVNLIATGSGTKDAAGFATDGDINARGTQISGQNVTLDAARDVNLQSAVDTSQQSSHNSSSGGSIGVGLGLGGQQNGFTLELAANTSHGEANGQSATNRDTQISASNTLSITSGRDTNLRGAEVAGDTVAASVGRDLNIQSPQDKSTYDSKQSSGGFQASICIPPFCWGQTVSGSVSVSQQDIKSDFQSVNQQSGIYAGNGGFNVNVGNHTQLDGGVIASTASADKNSLSTQSFGYTNLDNHASYSGDTIGFSASGGTGWSAKDGATVKTPVTQVASHLPGPQNSQGLGPSGFSVAGTGSDASGTTYAAVSAGTITVRGDAGTGHDSTAGLSRDTANANGAVQNTFDAQKVQNDMAVQQGVGQVGMQVVGDIAGALYDRAKAARDNAIKAQAAAEAVNDTAGVAQAQADQTAAEQQMALWANDGTARIGAHAIVAGLGAALGGGNVAGAMGGTIAGDMASNATSHTFDDSLGGKLLSNAIAGLAGAAAGGALGGSAGAMSGAGGALNADLYNRQLHPDEKKKLADLQKGKSADEQHKLAAAECALTQCAAGVPDNDPDKAALTKLQNEGQSYTAEQRQLKDAGAFDGYGWADTIVDLNDRYHLTTRAGGAVQGVTGAAAAVGIAGAGCSTGVGCALALTAAGTSLDYSYAGLKTAVSGDTASTYGQQVLQSLGMTPYAAGLTYAGLNLGGSVGIAVLTNQAGNDVAALNNMARQSYTTERFGAQGLQPTTDVMKTQQAQAVVDAYTAAGVPLQDAQKYAAGLIETGTTLPTTLAVNADTELIKVVPKGTFGGDSVSAYSPYFMTRAEYDALSKLPADQVAAKLGLPAEQAVRGSQFGFDVYSMTPRPGTDPQAFTSKVAPVQQGAYSAPGGAQQVLVPNRGEWTDPNTNKIGEIKGRF